MSEDALIPFKHEDTAPVFEEAWQAEALAMANALVETGAISATDWAEALGAARRGQEGQAETVSLYYVAVLTALEAELTKVGVPLSVLSQRKEDWIAAYRRTPHGKPVELL